MKHKLVLMILIVVISLVGLVVVEAASDEDTLKILDEQIVSYKQSQQTIKNNLEQAHVQIKQMEIQFQQYTGAIYAAEQLKKELLDIAKEKEIIADETLANIPDLLHDSEENESK